MSKLSKFSINEMIHKSRSGIFFSPNSNTIINLSRIDRIIQKEDEISFIIRGEFEYYYKYSFDKREDAVIIMNELRKTLKD
jgi:predicted metallo-beta-lactamase superfamily hydrolase